jgi:hypothetical protein
MSLRSAKLNPHSPGVARRAQRYAELLHKALTLASRRDSPKNPVLAALYSSAVVEGIDTRLLTRHATISFTAPPFTGGLHQIYDWRSLDDENYRDLATSISWSLRAGLKRR